MADGAIEGLIGNFSACWKCPSKNLKMKIKSKLNNKEIELDATNIEDSSDSNVRSIVSFLIKSAAVLRDINEKNNIAKKQLKVGGEQQTNNRDNKDKAKDNIG